MLMRSSLRNDFCFIKRFSKKISLLKVNKSCAKLRKFYFVWKEFLKKNFYHAWMLIIKLYFCVSSFHNVYGVPIPKGTREIIGKSGDVSTVILNSFQDIRFRSRWIGTEWQMDKFRRCRATVKIGQQSLANSHWKNQWQMTSDKWLIKARRPAVNSL